MGTLLHDRSADRPFHRLVATGKMFEAIFFGTRARGRPGARRRPPDALARSRASCPRTPGALPAGTPYSAHDPELMLWTIAPAADSAGLLLRAVRPRADRVRERDAFWADYVRFGELFGMPASRRAELLARASRVRGREDQRPGRLPDRGGAGHRPAVMLEIPTSRSRRPAMQVHNLVMRGSLPPRVRELYGLRWTAADAVAFRGAVAAAARPLRPLTPRSVRRGSLHRAVRRRRRRRAQADRTWVDRPGIAAPVRGARGLARRLTWPRSA